MISTLSTCEVGTSEQRSDPPRLDTTGRHPDYSLRQRRMWRQLFHRQEALLAGYAADEYLAGWRRLDLKEDDIPELARLSGLLERTTGWRIARVPGRLDSREFGRYLMQRIIPCTDHIRSSDPPNRRKRADCFFDIFGRLPLLLNTRFAEFYQQFGAATLGCRDPLLGASLAQIHRMTAEWGLILSSSGLRIYGHAAIANENQMQHCLAASVKKWPFRIDVVAAISLSENPYPDRLFVIHSFAELEREFSLWTKKYGLL